MGFPISCNNVAVPVGAATNIRGAGNYFFDSQTVTVVNVTAIAAGRVAGSLLLVNAGLTVSYAAITIEGVAGGAGIVPINLGFTANNVMWQRGDSINLFWLNLANTNAAQASFNLYGSNLP